MEVYVSNAQLMLGELIKQILINHAHVILLMDLKTGIKSNVASMSVRNVQMIVLNLFAL